MDTDKPQAGSTPSFDRVYLSDLQDTKPQQTTGEVFHQENREWDVALWTESTADFP